jgi:DNA-binding HxlR family transcriptional regulator
LWCSMEKHTDETCGADCGPTHLALPPPEINAVLRVLGGKWTIVIIWQLVRRTTRFNELKKAIPGITQHMLTSHLRELETDGIVVRTVYAEVPPRVEYALTEHGRSLEPVIRMLAAWGGQHLAVSQTAATSCSTIASLVRQGAG